MWPCGFGQIHTSVHAGGIASDLIRPRVDASLICPPLGVKYLNDLPARLRVMPGASTLTKRRFASQAVALDCRRFASARSPSARASAADFFRISQLEPPRRRDFAGGAWVNVMP